MVLKSSTHWLLYNQRKHRFITCSYVDFYWNVRGFTQGVHICRKTTAVMNAAFLVLVVDIVVICDPSQIINLIVTNNTVSSSTSVPLYESKIWPDGSLPWPEALWIHSLCCEDVAQWSIAAPQPTVSVLGFFSASFTESITFSHENMTPQVWALLCWMCQRGSKRQDRHDEEKWGRYGQMNGWAQWGA